MIVNAEILTYLPLAHEGVILEKASRFELERRMLDALKVDLPILNFLEASELITAEQVIKNQLWLVVLLAPASQAHIGALDADTSQPSKKKFVDEVCIAREQMTRVKWRIRQAIGEARSPAEDGVFNSSRSSTASIRQRVRSNAKGGKIWIPTSLFGMEIDIGSVPDHLARGAQICISTRITSIERKSAMLDQVSIAKDCRDRVKDIPLIGICNRLERTIDPHHAPWGTLLQLAMDNQTVLELPVVVTLDWVSGAAVNFRLSGPPR